MTFVQRWILLLSTRTRIFGLTASALTLPFGRADPARPVLAQPVEAAPVDRTPIASTRELIARLPSSVTLAVAVDHAAQLRVSNPGRSLWEFIRESRLMQRTQGAWVELAATLKVSPEQAFDDLLGRRALLVFAHSGEGKPVRWALMSEVSPNIEGRIRRGLAPAPRSIERGRPILSLERGAYELATTAGRPGRLSPPGSPSDEMILLAPTDDPRLFDELLAVLSGEEPNESIGKTKPWQHSKDLGNSDLFVWCNGSEAFGSLVPGEKHTPGPSDFCGFSAITSPSGWDAEFVASANVATWDAAHAAPLPGAAAEIERGAMMSYAGTLPLEGENGTRELKQLTSMFWPGLPPALLGHLGSTVVFALHPEAQGLEADSPTQIALSLAVCTDDIDATARDADEFVSWAIRQGKASGRQGFAAATISELEFSGFEPWKTRTLERRSEPQEGGESVTDASVAWACVPQQDPALGGGQPIPGWWLTSVALGPGPRDTAVGRLDLMRRLERESKPDQPALIARVVIRPALILQTLASRAPTLPDSFRALRWFELLTSECFTPRDGVVHGTIKIEMAAPPRPGKPGPSTLQNTR